MSSFHRRKAPPSEHETAMMEPLPCPECGKESMRRVQGDCKLLDGMVVRDLSRYQCSACGADFFDRAAMREISRQQGRKAIV